MHSAQSHEGRGEAIGFEPARRYHAGCYRHIDTVASVAGKDVGARLIARDKVALPTAGGRDRFVS